MNPNLTTLDKRIGRLENKLAALQAQDRRMVALRLGTLLAAVIGTWAAGASWGAGWGWGAFLLSAAIFLGVVGYHRRVDHWMRVFGIWRDIQVDRLARINLDWPNIHSPANDLQGDSFAYDLNLVGPNSLHHLVDTAVSREGSELLAAWLTDPHPDIGRIQRNQQLVRELIPLARFRNRLRLSFNLVSGEQLRGERLLRWLEYDIPASRLQRQFFIGLLLSTLNLALFILNSLSLLPPYWLASAAVYGFFYFSNNSPISQLLNIIVKVDSELLKFKAILFDLERFHYKGSPGLAKRCEPFTAPGERPSRQLRQLKAVTAAVGFRMNPLIGMFLNLLLPWDFACAYFASRSRDRLADRLPRWLEAWYELEALISLAEFANLNPDYSFPEVDADLPQALQAVGLGHPLIHWEQKICNDFEVPQIGAVTLITGSNMAGKSTFIKTIGINLCLAYAGSPVNADSLAVRPFRLHTCIQISDSLADGFSYFYAEVKCLKRLLTRLRQPEQPPLLYLIDEIFRGTNNRERLIGSRAYLTSLVGKNAIGFLATHDLELAGLAESHTEVRNIHFRDQVEAGRLVFDYKIHPGPCPTTNALRIMEMEGLPIN